MCHKEFDPSNMFKHRAISVCRMCVVNKVTVCGGEISTGPRSGQKCDEFIFNRPYVCRCSKAHERFE